MRSEKNLKLIVQIPCLNEASMGKYFTVESACSATDEAMRIFGAYGYSMEYNVQRYSGIIAFSFMVAGLMRYYRLLLQDSIFGSINQIQISRNFYLARAGLKSIIPLCQHSACCFSGDE